MTIDCPLDRSHTCTPELSKVPLKYKETMLFGFCCSFVHFETELHDAEVITPSKPNLPY
jgi:hypothetical protein